MQWPRWLCSWPAKEGSDGRSKSEEPEYHDGNRIDDRHPGRRPGNTHEIRESESAAPRRRPDLDRARRRYGARADIPGSRIRGDRTPGGPGPADSWLSRGRIHRAARTERHGTRSFGRTRGALDLVRLADGALWRLSFDFRRHAAPFGRAAARIRCRRNPDYHPARRPYRLRPRPAGYPGPRPSDHGTKGGYPRAASGQRDQLRH